MGMLGRPLPAQVAQLLLDEAIDARIELAQRTLAAMLGAQRPSINKILKEFERDRLITVGYAVIEITDQHGLRARLNDTAPVPRATTTACRRRIRALVHP